MDAAGMATAALITVIIAVTIAAIAFWIWALVDAIRVPHDSQYESGTKLVWVLVIVLLGWIGAIIYVAVGRPQGGASAAIARWGEGAAGSIPPRPADAPPPPAP
jgi:uncharacterized membrane protein